MESAFCAGFKEIGDDMEPRAPRSPFDRDPELTEGDEDRSPMHELRKSAQLHSVHFSFGVGEPPREEGLLKDKLQRAMSSYDGKDEGSPAGEKDCRDMREFSPSAHPKELEFDLTPAHEPPGGEGAARGLGRTFSRDGKDEGFCSTMPHADYLLPGMNGGAFEPGAGGNAAPAMPVTMEKQEVKLHETRGDFLGGEADLFANLDTLPDQSVQGGFRGGSGVALNPGDEVQAEPTPGTTGTTGIIPPFAPFAQGHELVEEVDAYIKMHSLSLETVAHEAVVQEEEISQWLSRNNCEPHVTVNPRRHGPAGLPQ